MPGLGRLLVLVGLVLVGIGFVLTWGDRIPFLGRLPGDLVVRRGNFTFSFPLVTSILLSFLLTLLLWLFRR